MLELVHDLTGLENVEEAIQRWKNGMLSREEENAQDKRTIELQQQMEATIATLRDELQQVRRHLVFTCVCEKRGFIDVYRANCVVHNGKSSMNVSNKG